MRVLEGDDPDWQAGRGHRVLLLIGIPPVGGVKKRSYLEVAQGLRSGGAVFSNIQPTPRIRWRAPAEHVVYSRSISSIQVQRRRESSQMLFLLRALAQSTTTRF